MSSDHQPLSEDPSAEVEMPAEAANQFQLSPEERNRRLKETGPRCSLSLAPLPLAVRQPTSP